MFARLSPYWLWFLLALPALGMFSTLTGGDVLAFRGLLHPTGEFAARFMIIGMMTSSLVLVFRQAWFPRWLRANRRYFGVAAFGYAALHTVIYLIDKASAAPVLEEITNFEIWTGWLGFLIFLPLAATSMDAAVRWLGTAWKPLQRMVYAAAALTLLHWASLHDWGGWFPAAVHFAPLAGLTAYRIWYWYIRPRRALPLDSTSTAAEAEALVPFNLDNLIFAEHPEFRVGRPTRWGLKARKAGLPSERRRFPWLGSRP